MTDESFMRAATFILLLVALVSWTPTAAAQCVVGLDSEGQRALDAAFEAQGAIRDHLEVAAIDRESRELSDSARDMDVVEGERIDERRRHKLTAQASLNFGTSGVHGFEVCDAEAWQPAKLQSADLGFAAGLGLRGLGRLELRLFGVSDSVIQSSLRTYYPEREADAEAAVPGATGEGHGLWSTRLELFDWVALTVGRSSSHGVEHVVGWDEDTDEDGNVSLVRTHTERWVDSTTPRTFLAVGVPRVGTSDLVLGVDHIDHFGVSSGWIVPRPAQPLAGFRVDGGYDGLSDVGLAGLEVIPLGGWFAQPQLPTFRARGAGEFASAGVRELSVGAQWGYAFTKLGLDAPGNLVALDLESGLYGGARLRDAEMPALVPGLMASVDAVLPIFAVLRLSAWAGVNRPETILAVPDAVGRAEVGARLYVSYSI